MNAIREAAIGVRPSIVGVVSPIGRGSGYVALPNGLIVTSLDVVGYEREVQIVLEDGSAAVALVVRVNVALDVALLMPKEAIALPPLEPGAEARIGDPVFVLGRIGVEPLLMPATIAATSRVTEGFAHIELDRAPSETLRGAPLVDASGNVLGLSVRPRRVRMSGGRYAHRWQGGLVLPNASFEGGLSSADGPPNEVLELMPEYGCPRCDTIFEPDLDRCLECGALLPHRWMVDDYFPATESAPPLKGLFAVKAALASIGIPANRARVGPRSWRFLPSFGDDAVGTQVDLGTDDAGDHLVLRAPLTRLPAEEHDHFYRYLLTRNDADTSARLGIYDGVVYVSLFEPVAQVDNATFPSVVTEFGRTLVKERSEIQRNFACEPVYEHEVD
ncbi:MAG TPA: serine protease [Polyangiaceae bacterium]|jgi:hypothetical protein|nr:serine protease [Polyangiaceae bacterium]